MIAWRCCLLSSPFVVKNGDSFRKESYIAQEFWIYETFVKKIPNLSIVTFKDYNSHNSA